MTPPYVRKEAMFFRRTGRIRGDGESRIAPFLMNAKLKPGPGTRVPWKFVRLSPATTT